MADQHRHVCPEPVTHAVTILESQQSLYLVLCVAVDVTGGSGAVRRSVDCVLAIVGVGSNNFACCRISDMGLTVHTAGILSWSMDWI